MLVESTGSRGNSVLKMAFAPNQKARTLTKKIIPKMIAFRYLPNDFVDFKGSSVHVFCL